VRSPITTALFTNIAIDFTVPGKWTVTKDRIYVYWNAEFYYVNGRTPIPEQQPALPYQNDSNDKHLQIFVGSTFIDSITTSIFDANPLVYIFIDESTLHSPFDVATLNIVLPGLWQYYGLVNRKM
jgi:hypothetical protein